MVPGRSFWLHCKPKFIKLPMEIMQFIFGNSDRRGRAVASLSLPDRPNEIVSFNLQEFDGFTEVTDLNRLKLEGAPIGRIEELTSSPQTALLCKAGC